MIITAMDVYLGFLYVDPATEYICQSDQLRLGGKIIEYSSKELKIISGKGDTISHDTVLATTL